MSGQQDSGQNALRVGQLETELHHLRNELRLTRAESEESTRRYLELYFLLEKKVKERTAELEELNAQLLLEVKERQKAEQEKESLIGELQGALAKVKTLSGLLPICAACKKIRDDRGYWSQIETYVREHSEAVFTHGICPDCAQQLYPGLRLGDG